MPDASTLPVVAGDRSMHAPGVYFGMAEDEYHADPSLGSTDIRRLRNVPYDWWWHSVYNPLRPAKDDDTKQVITKGDGRAVGTAIHLLVLGSRAAFDAAYVRRPEHVKKVTDAVAEKIAPRGQMILHADDYDRAVIAAAMIRANPTLGEAFSGGFPEVSVFWLGEFEGRQIPMKARFDYLRQRVTVDLKSIRNNRELPFVEACRRRIAEARYDMQAAHYNDGRRAMRSLVAAGEIHGCPDPALLSRIAATAEWAYVIVFFQASDAPLTWATSLSPANPILQTAREHNKQALANYITDAERFGFGSPWLIAEPVEEMDINDIPAWGWR